MTDEAFWERVDTTPGHGPRGDCHLWMGALVGDGYGNCRRGNRTELAHRVAFELVVGPIPEGHEIDHDCRVHNCVNVGHLEPVTHAENMRRYSEAVTHCRHGHAYTRENTYVTPSRTRRCRTCKRDQERARRQRCAT